LAFGSTATVPSGSVAAIASDDDADHGRPTLVRRSVAPSFSSSLSAPLALSE